ncbi:MAG: Sir2 family NAD-dependent protein deacetylase [Rubrivivax sp.]|nr:Sir2 family NAD-dependent protein deacetylase [Rubrivivax sp.]
MTPSAQIATAAELIAQADAIAVTAGAGMGVDSGLPDFRGSQGFWKAYPALQASGLQFEDVASPRTFVSAPRTAWGFYGHRLRLYRGTVPHAGFQVLRRWAERMLHGGWVYTSNVDGQFQKAGFDTQRIAECHGSIHRLQCTGCDAAPWPADTLTPDVDEAACRWLGPLPSCPRCGALARPNILMFSDSGWKEDVAARQERATEAWLRRVRRPLVVELGAGTAIPSVRRFGHRVIRDFGGRMLRINPRESAPPTTSDVGLALGAAEALAAIDAVLSP